MNSLKIIGYTEHNNQYTAIHEPGKGYIVTQAFILCKYCNGAVYHCMGPRSDAVCIPCYDKLHADK